MSLVLGACGESPPAEEASSPPQTLHWPAVEGATRYRVQAWHEYRLLFEISCQDTSAVLTPSLARAVAPFEQIEVQVRPLDPAGEQVAETHRVTWER